MSTQVVNEFHANLGRGDDVLALLVELSPESAGRPGCEAISIRRNQDDPGNPGARSRLLELIAAG
jgi:hypothetical protein